jgi:hypothetical protein
MSFFQGEAMNIRDSNFSANAVGHRAVEALHSLSVEREKTKRLLIGAACLFFLIAAVVAVFAPPGKETLAYGLGAALVVMALGAIGMARFSARLPGVQIEASGSPDAGGGLKVRPVGKAKDDRDDDGFSETGGLM